MRFKSKIVLGKLAFLIHSTVHSFKVTTSLCDPACNVLTLSSRNLVLTCLPGLPVIVFSQPYPTACLRLNCDKCKFAPLSSAPYTVCNRANFSRPSFLCAFLGPERKVGRQAGSGHAADVVPGANYMETRVEF